MTDSQDTARPKTGPEQAHGPRRAAESTAVPTGSTRTVRARTATAAPPAPRRRAAVLSAARGAAVVAASCAVLLGAAASGPAGSTSVVPVSAVQALLPDDAVPAIPSDLSAAVTAGQAAVKAEPAPAPAAPEPAAAEPAAAEPAAAEPAAAAPAEQVPVPAAPAPAPPVPAPVPVAPEPPAAPEPVALNDPAGAQAYARGQLASYGWGEGQMPCLVTLWTKESDWTTTATNPSSGAYGIVQSLPAEKMASAGADYRTNYRTQINWGLNYIQERYQSPCSALNFHFANNWY